MRVSNLYREFRMNRQTVCFYLVVSLGLLACATVTGGETVLTPGRDLGVLNSTGISVVNGQVVLYSLEDKFATDSLAQYKVGKSPSAGEDEFGIMDYVTDAAYVSLQTRPDTSIFVETHDNDSLTLSRNVTPTLKGYITFDIWPTRFWPTSGTVCITLMGEGTDSITFPMNASDYKHSTVKTAGGKSLSVPGGKPYFSSLLNSNIYVPSEEIADSEQRWWNMHLTFRPSYVAGSLDGSVCREIEDPDRTPILVRRFEIRVQQLETYIRALKFKAVLGEAVSSPVELTGASWGKVSWQGNAPAKTRIGLQVRGADTKEALDKAVWTGPSQGYFLTAGDVPADLGQKKFLQVKLLLKTENDVPFEVTPSVQSVTVEQKEAGK
jgi:hypothetical protein